MIDDLLLNILKFSCIFDFKNINKYKLINNFSKNICHKIKKELEKGDEYILFATEIEKNNSYNYQYNNFMIFDNLSNYNIYLLQLNNNSKSDVLILNSEFNPSLINYTIYNMDNYINYNLKFDIYFIYYFINNFDLNNNIIFIILPYFDEDCINAYNFHSYTSIKKNKIFKQNKI